MDVLSAPAADVLDAVSDDLAPDPEGGKLIAQPGQRVCGHF
jgi:hypothetical protein